MPESDQDQGGVPVTVAAVLGRLHESLNLGHGKKFPRNVLAILDGLSQPLCARPFQGKSGE